jgi:hypothetical protein
MDMTTSQATEVLVAAAADCGLDARTKSPAEVRKEFESRRSKEFSDQFDARLDAALKRLGA